MTYTRRDSILEMLDRLERDISRCNSVYSLGYNLGYAQGAYHMALIGEEPQEIVERAKKVYELYKSSHDAYKAKNHA